MPPGTVLGTGRSLHFLPLMPLSEEFPLCSGRPGSLTTEHTSQVCVSTSPWPRVLSSHSFHLI